MKNRKIHIIMFVICLFIILSGQAFGIEIDGMDNYLNNANEYINANFNLNASDMLESFMNGETGEIKDKVLNDLFKIFGDEFKVCLNLIAKILIIVLIASLLNTLSNNFGSSQVSEIGFFIAYTIIIVLIMTTFISVLGIVVEAIENMSTFMYSTIPILFTLVFITGSITTTTIFQPILLFLVSFISILVNKVVIPMILVITSLNIVSNLTEKDILSKLSDFFKGSTLWILGIVLTITIGVISLEGTLSGSIDGLTAKTAKTAISTFIPVVGKTLGDAIDTVMGSTVILKNSVGIVGVVILLAIGIIPIIKIAILMGMYYLTSAVIQPISDSRIVKCLGYIGDSFKILLAVLITIMFLYIISTALIIKITNFTFTYR